MSNIKTALVLYPNQLFAIELLPAVDLIYVVEEPLFFGLHPERRLKLNKKKLLFHRVSMRRYVEELLWQKDLEVEYVELDQIEQPGDILLRAQKAGFEQVMLFDLNDKLLESKLKHTIDKDLDNPFTLKILPTPSFLLKNVEVKEFFGRQTKRRFSDFYQWQRERFNVLIGDDYKPLGGQWVFELGKNELATDFDEVVGFESFGDNQYIAHAGEWVNRHFADSPGSVDEFVWPTDHFEAEKWLHDFIKNRLPNFAKYAYAIKDDSVLLNHSGLSVALNSGLLTPQQVVDEAVSFSVKNSVDIANFEGFIRRVIGWREYVRGLYVSNLVNVPKSPSRVGYINPKWLEATTGLEPLDNTIRKAVNNAYLMPNERTSIINNLMMLTDIHPIECYKWFMSMLLDAYDWAVQPNVFPLYNFDDMSGMNNQSPIADSNYILSTSNYSKDLWCDIWDGLFYRFVDRHRAMLANNKTTAFAVKNLVKITPEHRRIISYRAQDFLYSIE